MTSERLTGAVQRCSPAEQHQLTFYPQSCLSGRKPQWDMTVRDSASCICFWWRHVHCNWNWTCTGSSGPAHRRNSSQLDCHYGHNKQLCMKPQSSLPSLWATNRPLAFPLHFTFLWDFKRCSNSLLPFRTESSLTENGKSFLWVLKKTSTFTWTT